MMDNLSVLFQGLGWVFHNGIGWLKSLRKQKFILLFLVFSLLAGAAYAAVPVLSSGAFTGGGGLSASGGVQLNGSLGQPLVGRQTSAGLVLCSGVPDCASTLLVNHTIFLPLVTK
jgi:hypothetical protein